MHPKKWGISEDEGEESHVFGTHAQHANASLTVRCINEERAV